MIYVKETSSTQPLCEYDSILTHVDEKFNTLLNKLAESISYIEYRITAYPNQYVSPYTHIVTGTIPASDIRNIGRPISISAIGTNGAPVPAVLEYTPPHEYSYKVVTNSPNVILKIVFLDTIIQV